MCHSEFKKELRELLTKYSATISFECGSCSDLAGIYDEKIVISQYHGQVLAEKDGYELEAIDLI